MSNQQPINEYAHNIALPWKPDGRKYRITNLKTRQSMIVTHTDYGPAKWTGNVADLMPAVFRKLGGRLGDGKIRVKIERKNVVFQSKQVAKTNLK
jgi:rare lipoprotein A (peptidoglycan hydrolase)